MAMPNGITFTVTPSVDPEGRNIVEWRVENTSGYDHYLFDGIVADPRSPSTVAGSVYFRWLEGDTLILFQGIPEVPDFLSVLFPYVPKASRLDDHTTRRKTVVLPDTVYTHRHYGNPDDPTGEGASGLALGAAFVQIRIGAVRNGDLAVVDAGRVDDLQLYAFRDMDAAIAAADLWYSARVRLHHPVFVVD